MALCGLAFARPVLDTFGRSPESFVARSAGPGMIVAFAVIVLLAPPLVLAVAGLATRAFGPRARVVSHAGLVLVVGAIAGRRLVRDVTGGEWAPTVVIPLGVGAGVALAALRWRTAVAASFLRVAGAASVVYLVQFLVLSPTADLVIGDGAPGVDHEVAASVSAALGDGDRDPPDVVLLVFDALPTQTLLDGEGRVDADLFPNFAALAGTSSWYRNATTVSMFTRDAVPAILTGRFPDPTNEPDDVPADDPENLFTLLGASYDLHAREQITQLCPDDLCPRPASEGLSRLLGDAVQWWRSPGVEDDAEDEFSLPALLDDDRFREAEEWAREVPDTPAEAAAARADGPDLHFFHAALPHDPWQFLPDGTLYETERYPVGYFRTGWYGPGIGVGHQRHVLQAQAADHLLGEVLDRLRASGALDDTLVVVTADHGHAFVAGTAWRWLSQRNHEELMWAPLLVKQPGQREAEVVDDNVMSIDIVPTIAETLGVALPWKVDGRPVGEASRRDQDVKYVDDDEDNIWRAEPNESLVRVTGTQASFRRVVSADPVTATGPDAVWQRTPHGALVGQSVSRLDVGEAWPGDAEVDVEDVDRLRDIDVDDPLPLEAIGRSDLDEGTYVAYALNGTVAALAEVEEDSRAGGNLVLGLLRPDLFVPGENRLATYVVAGEPGGEVLRPVPLAGST